MKHQNCYTCPRRILAALVLFGYCTEVRESGNIARDTAVWIERATGSLNDLMVCSLTPTCYPHRCAFVAPRLIGTDQKCARGRVEQERDSEMLKA